jgi:hypothetical protein
MPTSIISSFMNMTADVLIQQRVQSESSGSITREWVYDQTIQCKVMPVKSSGASIRGDSKTFDVGKNNEYHEKLELKMTCLMPLSKRWRVSSIKANNGVSIYTEIDKYDNPDTIFEVMSSHAVVDPFGKISYYDVILQRVQVQNDSTANK